MLSLQDAYYHTVHDYPGGADSLAPRMSPAKSPSQLANEARPPANNQAKAGLISAAQLVELTGDKRLAISFAARCGGYFLPLPAIDLDLPPGEVMSALSRTAKEFSDLVAKVTEVSADANISDNELRSVEREATELMSALYGLMQVLVEQHAAAQR